MALLRTPRTLIGAAIAAAVIAAGGSGLTAQSSPTESEVKAVFLFNFAKYVTWPAFAIGERSPADIRICATANDAFFNLLKTAVQGEDIDGKPLVAVSLNGLDDARRCQILYVGDAKTADARAWLNAVRGAQVLTVADGALTDGAIIAFVRDSNRIRFDIDRTAASQRNLNISSKLLRLARQVRER